MLFTECMAGRSSLYREEEVLRVFHVVNGRFRQLMAGK